MDKESIKTFDINEFIIKKGKTDNELWTTILRQSQQSTKEKIQAAKSILKNYRIVPVEADDILKALATVTETKVRKAIALEIIKKDIKIPGSLHGDLIKILMDDPNQEIKRIIKPYYIKFIKPFHFLPKFGELTQAITSLNASLEIAKIYGNYNKFVLQSMFSLGDTFSKILKILNEPGFKHFEYKWLGFLPIDTTIKMYKMHKEGKDAEIDQALFNVLKNEKYIDDFLIKMQKIEVFSQRIHIIKEAIKAHVDEKYSLSVPVLLAQIEGILWAYAEKQGVHYQETFLLQNGEQRHVGNVEVLLRKTKMKDKINKEVVREYLNRIYVSKFRHGILHGRLIEYNTEKNSMRLLLFLRALLEECS